MNFKVVFCKDGILRASCHGSKVPLPLRFLQIEQQGEKLNDLKFLAKWWEETVVFEEGTTVGSFLHCLEPWQEFWKDFIGKDIPAYIKESKKPHVVKTSKDKDDAPLDWIKLFYATEVSPSVSFEERKKGESFTRWLNSDKKVRFDGTWDFDSAYKLSGYRKGEEEQYSIDGSPMNELANVPFILSNEHIVYETHFYTKRYLGERKELFNQDAIGFRILDEDKRHHFSYVMAEKYHNMRGVVEAFFWWFASTPESRDDFTDMLKERVKEVDELIKEDKTEDNEVIKDDDTGVKGNLKIRVAPDAFDDMIAHDKHEKDYWKTSVEKFKKSKSKKENVVRIGGIKEAVPFENRIFASIVEPKDLSTDFLEKIKFAEE